MKNAKKHVAIALALLCLTNTFAPAPFLDVSPKVNASFFSKKDFIVKSPIEYSEFKKTLEEVKNDIPIQKNPLNCRIQQLNELALKLSLDTDEQKELSQLNSVKEKIEQFENQLKIFENAVPVPDTLPIAFVDYNKSNNRLTFYDERNREKTIEAEINDKIADYSAHLVSVYAKCVAQGNGVRYIVKDESLINLLRDKEFADYCKKYFPKFNYQKSQKALGMIVGEVQTTGYANEFLVNYIENHGDPFAEKEDEASTSMALKLAVPFMIIFGSSMAINGLNSTITFLKSAYSGMSSAAGAAYKRFVYNRKQIGDDPVALRNLLHEFLNETVVKQEDAVEKIINTITGMTNLWAQHDKNGTECTCACTMTFIGDSGVGKTWAARMLSKAIFDQDMQPWQFVTSTSITNTNASIDGKKLSPADQIFNQNSELIRQLTRNPRVVVVFDEIDKMHKWDPEDSVLERLRDARDTGKLLVKDGINQHYIDVSRTVFICISNELRECWGLPKNENLSPQHAAARTYIKRDQSLVNRFEVIEFKDFDKEDYKYFLAPSLEEVKKDFLETFGLDLSYTDEFIDSLATASELKNKGVRGVNDYAVLLRGALVKFISDNPDVQKSENESAKEVTISYDIKTNSFNVNLK